MALLSEGSAVGDPTYGRISWRSTRRWRRFAVIVHRAHVAYEPGMRPSYSPWTSMERGRQSTTYRHLCDLLLGSDALCHARVRSKGAGWLTGSRR